MHVALASESDDRAFVPEPFTPFYQRSLYQTYRRAAILALQALRQQVPRLPADVRPDAERLIGLEEQLLDRFSFLLGPLIRVVRMRQHGDLHLRQVLYTSGDFYFIDVEGEPTRPLSERRLKRSALRDVAGMLRSFEYAAQHGLIKEQERAGRPGDVPKLEPWARYWSIWASAAFLRGYLSTAADAPFVPRNSENLHQLLQANLLEKALYELDDELNNRPEWIGLRLRGILWLLGES
ncbi:MAG: hypothetical protein EXR58_07885 [Chloroflexi bacterium]|nr:hypothetical protein [Chloroflexota bacterium]